MSNRETNQAQATNPALEHALFTRAQWWLAQGAELVPIRAGSKALFRGFGPHSRHVTTEREAWFWFDKLKVNLGVVCGGLIGLTCVDFDDASVFDDWRGGPGKNVRTLIEKTGRGYHVFFTAPGQALPSVLTAQVELKASGVVMTAPSLHPSGRHYEILTDDPIAPLTRAQLDTLFPFVSEVLRQPAPPVSAPITTSAPLPPPFPRQETHYQTRHREDVVSRIKAARPVSEEARTLTDLHGREGHLYGRCPFHEDRQPSFWVDDEAGLWGCYSPPCPTNAGGQKAHDVINLRVWAKGITIRDAIRELAAECLPALSHPSHTGSGARRNTHGSTHEGRSKLYRGSAYSAHSDSSPSGNVRHEHEGDA